MNNFKMDGDDLVLEWSDDALEFFRINRIFLDYPNKILGVFENGELVRIPGSVRVERYANVPHRRFISSGAFSYCKSQGVGHEFQLGRYCSVGPSVMLGYQEHPLDRISTHPFTTHAHMVRFAREEFNKKIMIHKHAFTSPAPTIGSDVWIGAQSIIKRGVSIGHGSIIATRAFVSKDVPPYAIAGGLPAKVIRYRFSDKIIEKLLALQWWRFNYSDFEGFDFADTESFIDGLQEKIELGAIKEMDNKEYLRHIDCAQG